MYSGGIVSGVISDIVHYSKKVGSFQRKMGFMRNILFFVTFIVFSLFLLHFYFKFLVTSTKEGIYAEYSFLFFLYFLQSFLYWTIHVYLFPLFRYFSLFFSIFLYIHVSHAKGSVTSTEKNGVQCDQNELDDLGFLGSLIIHSAKLFLKRWVHPLFQVQYMCQLC